MGEIGQPVRRIVVIPAEEPAPTPEPKRKAPAPERREREPAQEPEKVRRRMCEECGKYPADLPSRICAGCDAYREHTGAF